MKLKSHNMNVGASIKHLDTDGSLIKEYYYPTSNNGAEPFIEAKVENENGEVIYNEKYPFRSFNYNYMGVLRWFIWPTVFGWGFGIKTLNGSLFSGAGLPGYYGEGIAFPGAYSHTYNGICVGTSSVTNSMDMIDLYGKIEHGNGTNELGYQTQIASTPYIMSSSYYYTINRSFINSSSLPVNIREIGIIASRQTTINNATNSFLFCRDTKDYASNDINIVLPTASILHINFNFIYPDNNHLVKQFAQIQECIGSVLQVPARTISSGSINLGTYSRGYGVNLFQGNVVNEDCGIVVGSSSQAFSLDDYKLYGNIPAGTDTSSLYHNKHVISGDVSGSDSGSFYMERLITNLSPNAFTIEEMGLYNYNGTLTSRYLWARTLTGTINLQPSQSLDIKYHWNVVASGS